MTLRLVAFNIFERGLKNIIFIFAMRSPFNLCHGEKVEGDSVYLQVSPFPVTDHWLSVLTRELKDEVHGNKLVT